MPKRKAKQTDDSEIQVNSYGDTAEQSVKKQETETYPVLSAFPNVVRQRCDKKWGNKKGHNVVTLFIPATFSQGAKRMMDMEQPQDAKGNPALHPSLVLLDLINSSLDKFSGTPFVVPAQDTPAYAAVCTIEDFKEQIIEIHDPDGGSHMEYQGKYYITTHEEQKANGGTETRVKKTERYSVWYELLEGSSAFDANSLEKMKEECKKIARKEQDCASDPLREGNLVSLLELSKGSNIKGILVHFVGHDPMFNLKECVLGQIYDNKKKCAKY